MARVTIIIPNEIPPTVNHYKKPITVRGRHGGRHIAFGIMPEALAFKRLLGVYARGRSLDPKTDAARRRTRYVLRLLVYLGPKQRGDGDNFFKCVADGLKDAGVIHSDAAIADWHCYVRRAETALTVVTVWSRGGTNA